MTGNTGKIIDMNQLTAATSGTRAIYELSQGAESAVKLAVLKEDGQWHSHEKEAEVFYVVAGTLWLDIEQGEVKTFELGPQQAYVVPKQVPHRARTPQEVTMLLVEHTV